MARHTPDESDLNRSAELEQRLERDSHRERVSLRRIVTDEDRRESLALNFASAFTCTSNCDIIEHTALREHDCVGNEDCPVCHAGISADSIDYDTLAEREMDVRS